MGRGPPVDHPARDLEAGQPGHLDVEEHQVRLQAIDGLERLHAVARLADDFDAPDLAEEIAQLIARQLLVVDEDGQSDPSCCALPVQGDVELGDLHAERRAAPGLLVSFSRKRRRRSCAAAR